MREDLGLSILEPGRNKNEPIKIRNLTRVGEKEGDDYLRAYQTLVKDSLFKTYFEGLDDKLNRGGRDPSKLASIENAFVGNCFNLHQNNIGLIVNKFSMGFSKYLQGISGLSIIERNKIVTAGNLNLNGIVNVIDLVQGRKKFLDSKPSNLYGHYFENTLDAKHKIDIIECIYKIINGEIIIEKLNIFQVKSSMPSVDEQEKIVKAHKEWITDYVMNMKNFEEYFSQNIPNEIVSGVKTFSENVEETANALEELYTSEEGFNPDKFLKNFFLGEELKDQQKAWLFFRFSTTWKKTIREAMKKGLLKEKEQECERILDELQSLEDVIKARAKMPKNIAKISEANSVIIVGSDFKGARVENLFKNGKIAARPKILGHDYNVQ